MICKNALILFFMSFCDVSFFSVWVHTFISAESHGFSLSDSLHLAAESRSSELLCIFCAASREQRSSPQAAATQQGFDLFSGGDYYYKQISLLLKRRECVAHRGKYSIMLHFRQEFLKFRYHCLSPRNLS